jgi:DNA-binding NarL/FixJ family response regulator
MRILLADDHALVRAGIRELIARLPVVTDVIEVTDGSEALTAVLEHKPDIVLMDIAMPRMNGLEATSRIAKVAPATRVIILSMHRSAEFVRTAFQVGATGYLLKTAAVSELQDAVRAVVRGTVYVSPEIRATFDDWRHPRVELTGRGHRLAELTLRQREVLQLVAEGQSTRQIADALQIHVKTVESHRTELMKRLGIHNVAGLVRYAIRHGLITSN